MTSEKPRPGSGSTCQQCIGGTAWLCLKCVAEAAADNKRIDPRILAGQLALAAERGDWRMVDNVRYDLLDESAPCASDVELDSPNFVPQAAKDLAARGFERINRASLKASAAAPASCTQCGSVHDADLVDLVLEFVEIQEQLFREYYDKRDLTKVPQSWRDAYISMHERAQVLCGEKPTPGRGRATKASAADEALRRLSPEEWRDIANGRDTSEGSTTMEALANSARYIADVKRTSERVAADRKRDAGPLGPSPDFYCTECDVFDIEPHDHGRAPGEARSELDEAVDCIRQIRMAVDQSAGGAGFLGRVMSALDATPIGTIGWRRSEAARPVIPHFEPQRRPTRADQEPCTAEASFAVGERVKERTGQPFTFGRSGVVTETRLVSEVRVQFDGNRYGDWQRAEHVEPCRERGRALIDTIKSEGPLLDELAKLDDEEPGYSDEMRAGPNAYPDITLKVGPPDPILTEILEADRTRRISATPSSSLAWPDYAAWCERWAKTFSSCAYSEEEERLADMVEEMRAALFTSTERTKP